MIRNRQFHNSRKLDIGDVAKGVAPYITSFGISRIGSGITSKILLATTSNEIIKKMAPVGISIGFVGLSYLITRLSLFNRYTVPALVGSSVNVLFTLIAQASPTIKGLMGLAGVDYSHVSSGINAPSHVGHTHSNKVKNEPIMALVPHEDSTEEDSEENESNEDLSSGIFAEKWTY